MPAFVDVACVVACLRLLCACATADVNVCACACEYVRLRVQMCLCVPKRDRERMGEGGVMGPLHTGVSVLWRASCGAVTVHTLTGLSLGPFVLDYTIRFRTRFIIATCTRDYEPED